jgi:dTMP kinase
MADHDQRFKVLLEEFLPEFFQLFFPEWYSRFDFTGVEWLRQEIFTDPPTGQRRVLDMIARLPLHQPEPPLRPDEEDHLIALLHIEIESDDTVEPFRSRAYHYYEQLRRNYRVPVLPIAVYLQVGLDGIGIDEFRESFGPLQILHFQYLYVGLPALDAAQYVRGANWLGVALSSLMRCPRDQRVILAVDALRRLSEYRDNTRKRFLLAECVGAYSPLDDELRAEFDEVIRSAAEKKEFAVEMSLLDLLTEKGRRDGMNRSLLTLLEARFGELHASVAYWIASLGEDQVLEKIPAALKATSLEQLGYSAPPEGGLFLSLDGLDGCGKSTQCKLLADWLRSRGYRVTDCVDPGGTALGSELRAILLHHKQTLAVTAETLLFMASRAQLVSEVIRPALAERHIVVSDRFLLANVVYQGHAGGMDVGQLWEIGKLATGGLTPDLTLILDLPVETARARRNRPDDNMESRGGGFHERVRQGFLDEASRQPDCMRVLDARASADEVHARIVQEVSRVLETGPRA